MHESHSGCVTLETHKSPVVGNLEPVLKWNRFLIFNSLGPPSYVLPLNLNFPSVLCLGLRYISRFSLPNVCGSNQRTEGVAKNDDVDVVR